MNCFPVLAVGFALPVLMNGFIFAGDSNGLPPTLSLKELAARKVAQTFADRNALLNDPKNVATEASLEEIATHLSTASLNLCKNREACRAWYLAKVVQIERILTKFGPYIPLSKNPKWKDSAWDISPVDPTQELWVVVFGDNPAAFKDKKYCLDRHSPEWAPDDSYKEIVVDGKTIGMCPDFPMESISSENLGKKIAKKN